MLAATGFCVHPALSDCASARLSPQRPSLATTPHRRPPLACRWDWLAAPSQPGPLAAVSAGGRRRVPLPSPVQVTCARDYLLKAQAMIGRELLGPQLGVMHLRGRSFYEHPYPGAQHESCPETDVRCIDPCLQRGSVHELLRLGAHGLYRSKWRSRGVVRREPRCGSLLIRQASVNSCSLLCLQRSCGCWQRACCWGPRDTIRDTMP